MISFIRPHSGDTSGFAATTAWKAKMGRVNRYIVKEIQMDASGTLRRCNNPDGASVY